MIVGYSRTFGGVTPVTPSLISNHIDSVNRVAYDFTVTGGSINLSDVPAGDVVTVIACGRTAGGATGVNSFDIGGIAATVNIHAVNGIGQIIIASAVMTGSQTNAVGIAYGAGSQAHCGITVIRMEGAAGATEHDDGSDITLSGSDLSASVATPAGGCIVAGHYADDQSITRTWSLANEAVDTVIEADESYSTAFEGGLGAGTQIVTVTQSGTSTSRQVLAVASFPPA